VAERDQRALGAPPGLRVIPNGVDIADDATAVRRGIDVLFVGNFESANNRDAMRWFLGDVWLSVLDLAPAATLTVVGPNPPAFLTTLRSPQVAVTGEVPSTAPYYRRAKLAVAPLRFGTGIKNKILEAFACGVAVVSTPEANEGIDAPPEAIVLADDARGMARAIAALLADDARREELAASALRFVRERFTWERAARSYLDLYAELLRDRPPR
jgi:glycosyltransferase involved in cell wall biosynthesis